MRILQAFCFLLLAAACASGGALAIGEAAPDPQSSVATSVSTYVDSAAVYQALLGAPEPPAGSDVPPVFTVAFDEQGRLDSIMPALPGLPRAFADSVIRLLQPHVKRQSRTAKKQNAFLYAAGAANHASPSTTSSNRPRSLSTPA